MLTTAPASFAAFCPDGGTTYAAGNGPIMAQACDLNGDGYPDPSPPSTRPTRSRSF
jgi:hypothetical protein